MVFPVSPFPNSFDISSIYQLGEVAAVTTVAKENLKTLLTWLCTTPKITTFRVNTLKYDVRQIKQLIENHLRENNQSPKVYVHPVLEEVIVIESLEQNDLDLSKKDREVIIDCSCGAAVLRGANVYAPGVIGMQNGTKQGDAVSVYVDVDKNCRRGFSKLYECANKIFVGNGTVLMTRDHIFGENHKINGVAIEMTAVTSGCPTLNENNFPVASGMLQNIPSVLCAYILNPRPNDVVLDMCASPGNKTTHIGQFMGNTGTLIAIDKTRKKHCKLQEKCAEFCLESATTFQYDSTKLCDDNTENDGQPPFLPNTFDKILLDAPCSAFGSRPQFANKTTEKVMRSFVPLQRKLFENAVKLLKSGGTLLYSTCTITLAENEGITSWALRKFGCLELLPAEPKLGGCGWSGTNLTEEQLGFVQRFGPDHEDSVGFYLALFRKKY